MSAQTQDYTKFQPSFAAESSAINRVMKKQEKKQNKELLHLATVLKVVEEELASAKSGATMGSEPQEGNAPSNRSMEDILAEMTGALQMLQVTIAKYSENNADNQDDISKVQLGIAEQNLTNAKNAMKKLAKKQHHEKEMSFWEKFAAGFVGAVLAIVAAVTMQPELLIAAGLCFASATGLMQDASTGVAKLLQVIFPNMSSQLANVIAGAIVCVVTIAATLGASSVAGVSTLAATATDAAAEDVAETAEVAVSESNSVFSRALSKAAKGFKDVSGRLSPRAKLIMLATIQSISSTNVASDTAGAIAYGSAKGQNKQQAQQRAEEDMSYVVAGVSLVLSIGVSTALYNDAANLANEIDSAAQLAEGASIAKRALSRFQDFGTSLWGQRVFDTLMVTAGMFETGFGTAAGAYQLEQGILDIDLGKYSAATAVNNNAISMNNSVMQGSQRATAQSEKQFQTSDRAIQNLMKGESAFAELLANNSPV